MDYKTLLFVLVLSLFIADWYLKGGIFLVHILSPTSPFSLLEGNARELFPECA